MSNDSLETMLERIENVSDEQDQVSFGEALDATGQHSFAPILLLIGMVMMTPGPADIPGVPILLGMLVILVAVQILLGREHIWMPGWIERRRVGSEKVQKMVGWFRRPAACLDRITKKRYSWMLHHAGVSIIAVACIVIAAATPIMEVVPFSANVAGAAIATFALAIIAKNGLVAGLAMACALVTIGLVAYKLPEF